MDGNKTRDELILVLSVPRSQIEHVRELAVRLGGPKSEDFDRSQRELGVDEESWFLVSSSQGDHVIIHLEGRDLDESMRRLIVSTSPFDRWIKNEVREITGIDWNNPPKVELPERILKYKMSP